MLELRTCTSCGEAKPLSEFWKDRSKKHGYTSKCKPYKTLIFNKYRKDRGYDAKRYWRNPQGERERHLVRKYGVTQAEYDALLNKQNGCCAICGRTQLKAFDIDHDHATGRIRGLLCTNCNRMVGHAHDDAERLEKAAAYLRENTIVPQVAAEFVRAFIEIAGKSEERTSA